LIVHYHQGFLITLYAHLMSYYPAIHAPSSHNSNNIWRDKLWSFSSCSIIHFPITFRCKSLNTLNSTIPIFSLQSSLKVTHQVSYTSIYKKYWVNMHTFVSQNHVFRQQSKIIRCSVHYSKFMSSLFLNSTIFTSYYPF
jgi:hypothetical protein